MATLSILSNTSQSDKTTISIAIKKLKNETNIEKEWDNECKAHLDLDPLDRDHLVQAIAAYRQGDDYRLLFEWADGGDLRSYWGQTKYTGLTPTMILEHLTELHGLTGALCKMHTPKDARLEITSQSQRERLRSAASSRSISSNLRAGVSPGPDVDRLLSRDEGLRPNSGRNPQISIQDLSENPGMDVDQASENIPTLGTRNTNKDPGHWHHGDIKPENILRFTKGQTSLGTLKLADLGRAKQHWEATKQRLIHEYDQWRTKPYEPPDIYIEPERSMSRLFDVWSLGCVFFESIVWLLYGQKWLQEFREMTQSADQNETPFWIREKGGNSAIISPYVEACVNHMFKEDPECNSERGSALQDFLNLVRSKMLVIDLPRDTEGAYTGGSRAHTEIIMRELNRIIQRSKSDHSYLFTGADRSSSNIRPLPEPPRPAKSPSDTASTPVPKHFGNTLDVPKGRWDPGTYSGVPTNRWTYQNDDSFAQKIYRSHYDDFDMECIELDNDSLCRTCQQLSISTGDLSEIERLRKVQDLKKTCCFCTLLRNRVDAAGLNKAAFISLSRNETGLRIKSKEGMSDRNAQLRLCRSPSQCTPVRFVSSSNRTAQGTPTRLQPKLLIPTGLPRLPEIGSKANFKILRYWLHDCDQGHGHQGLNCTSSQQLKHCPNRLLDVGISPDAKSSRIVDTKLLRNELSNGRLKYVALSHPWGKITDQSQHFVSTNANMERRMEGILDHALPKNFGDAVRVARQLGVQYV